LSANHSIFTRVRRAATATLLTAALTLTTACGDDSRRSDPTSSHEGPNGDVYDNADVSFATQMIPHHAQAVQMVTMTDGRHLSPGFKTLTDDIRAAQVPEIEAMTDWLTDWGKKVPETSNDHTNAGHDMGEANSGHGMGDVPGMMSQDDVDELERASGTRFEAMWLTMMIRHHEGAIEMARAEIRSGRFPAAVTLARSIVSSQTAEITTMKAMLAAS
jgi:uncharacterized protein (DUF305 family)